MKFRPPSADWHRHLRGRRVLPSSGRFWIHRQFHLLTGSIRFDPVGLAIEYANEESPSDRYIPGNMQMSKKATLLRRENRLQRCRFSGN